MTNDEMQRNDESGMRDRPTAQGNAPSPPGLGPVPSSALRRSAFRIIVAPTKFIWGMVLCQSVIGALAVLGWTHRLVQRSVVKQWWKLSASPARTERFTDFVAGDTRTEGHVHWPNWFFAQNFRRTHRGASSRRWVALFESLWLNVGLGVQALFN